MKMQNRKIYDIYVEVNPPFIYNKSMNKRFIPYAHAQNIFEIDLSFYKKNKIKHIFVDLDNTLDSYKSKIPSKRTIDFYNTLVQNGISLTIVSNNVQKRVKEYAEALGVKYFCSIRKPFYKRICNAITKLGYNKDDIVMIGDQIFTDVACGNGAKIKTILVEKLVKEDQLTTRINRIFDKPYRKKLERKKLLIDWRDR